MTIVCIQLISSLTLFNATGLGYSGLKNCYVWSDDRKLPVCSIKVEHTTDLNFFENKEMV